MPHFRQKSSNIPLNDLRHLVEQWLQTPDYRGERRFLEAYLELLDPHTEDILNDLIIQCAQQPDTVQGLRDHLTLLRDIVRRGKTITAIREGYVNAFGGLTLNLPLWLEKIEQQLDELRHAKRSSQTADCLTLLRTALVRTQKEENTASEVLAALNSRLWSALEDAVGLDDQQRQEEEITCLQAALQIYTYARYPNQYAMAQYKLGITYNDRIEGERRANLEQSIACYQETLRIYTRDAFPVEYASINSSLGAIYEERIEGERRANLERAITCYQEALRVYTFETFPTEYATVVLKLGNTSLGNTYRERIGTEQNANLERAISCYCKALRVYTIVAFPGEYAATQTFLGVAYWKRIEGERRTNLELAISCYQKALRVFTYDRWPQQYATTQNNLGLIYRERIEGERRTNLERAIMCFREALRVNTFENYATTLSNLGLTYEDRLEGTQRDNLEQAIACYKKAQNICTFESSPVDYAIIQNNLGNAYWTRIEGEQRANLEQAIICYQEALRVRTVDAFPVDYATTQNNLGLAYWKRLEGERRTNQEQAITCFREALSIRTVDAFPVDYATTLDNLGGVFRERLEGERRTNLEFAIMCYQAALHIRTLDAFPQQYAATQDDLGNIYVSRIEGERHANLEKAIACTQESLRVYSPTSFPADYASAKNSLGTAYRERIEGERHANLEKAIACFQEALHIYTLDTFPIEYRMVQINLALVEEMQGNWAGVHEAYSDALDAEDLLVSLGAGITGKDMVLREGHDAAVQDGYALTRLARPSEAAVALERGRARGLAEAMALNVADPGFIHNDTLRAQYAIARARFITAQKDFNALLPHGLTEDKRRSHNLEYTEIYHQAKNKFDAIVAEIRSAHDPSDFLETKLNAIKILQIAEQAGPGHALVYLAATPRGGIAVGVLGAYPRASEKDCFVSLDLPHFTTDFVDHLVESQLSDETQRIIGGFAHAQVGSAWGLIQQRWSGATFQQQAETLHGACKQTGQISTLDAAAQELLTISAVAQFVDQPLAALSETSLSTLENTLNHLFLSQELSCCLKALADAGLCQLVSWLQAQDITSLTLIPCGSLAAFPLVAVPLVDGRTVGETLPTSIAPSARSLLYDEQTRSKRTGVYAIGDPWSTIQQQLLWGEAEAHTLVELGQRLRGLPGQARVYEAATRTWLIEVLQRGSIVDASCHGYFNMSEPLQSALFLAADERLTLNENGELHGRSAWAATPDPLSLPDGHPGPARGTR